MERLAPVLQQELHRVASAHLAAERRGHILQTTALVNETYLRLIDWKNVRWQNRRSSSHGLADDAPHSWWTMHARNIATSAVAVRCTCPCPRRKVFRSKPPAISWRWTKPCRTLESFAPRQGRIVELRFFGGLSLEETAEVLEVSVGTVRRDWSLARAWLYRELNRKTP
jgi:RNA polymerase sigma-70 factor, ECF subfamily